MKVKMTSATANALARTTGVSLDNVKAEAETVAGPRTEPQITWPRNSVGEYTTIAELMSEATETDRQRCAIALAIQAYIRIRYAVSRRAAILHSLRAKPGFGIERVTISVWSNS